MDKLNTVRENEKYFDKNIVSRQFKAFYIHSDPVNYALVSSKHGLELVIMILVN